jgi:V/A-type H+-transporting ATPase subunit F
MKAYLISDNVDTEVGMRLAGVKGVIVHNRDEVLTELNRITQNNEIGIILITEKLASMVREEIIKIKLNEGLPLIVEIPDRHGTTREKDSITRYVKESIGLKI